VAVEAARAAQHLEVAREAERQADVFDELVELEPHSVWAIRWGPPAP
jgi:hypothetical protein